MQELDSTRKITTADNYNQELHKDFVTQPAGVEPADHLRSITNDKT